MFERRRRADARRGVFRGVGGDRIDALQGREWAAGRGRDAEESTRQVAANDVATRSVLARLVALAMSVGLPGDTPLMPGRARARSAAKRRRRMLSSKSTGSQGRLSKSPQGTLEGRTGVLFVVRSGCRGNGRSSRRSDGEASPSPRAKLATADESHTAASPIGQHGRAGSAAGYSGGWSFRR